MSASTIRPIALFQTTLQTTPTIYVPLITLAAPGFVLSLLGILIPFVGGILLLANALIIGPIMGAAMIISVDQHLTQRPVTLSPNVEKAIGLLVPLVLGSILLFLCIFAGLIALVIPGIYLMIRLGFAIYAITLESQSAVDGLKYSWNLVKGHWWRVFLASLLVGLAIGIPIGLISELTGNTLILNILSTALVPFLVVFSTLLFRNLQQVQIQPPAPLG